MFQRKRRKEDGKERKKEGREKKQGRGKKEENFFKVFTQINEYYPSKYRGTNDPGAQNLRIFCKIQSKY